MTSPLGAAIRERRLANELTLVGLAERSGLSQPFLSQVETGKATPSMTSNMMSTRGSVLA